MKKVVLSVAIIAAIGFTSCTSEKKADKEEVKTEKLKHAPVEEMDHSKMDHDKMAVAEYQCPMKCEGDKTYADKDAKCPKCNMALKEVKHEDGGMHKDADKHEEEAEHKH